MKNRKLSFRSNSAYGFSVVELIVALTIMTIIVTVGFSAYTYFQTDYGKVANTLKINSQKYDLIKLNIYEHIYEQKPICDTSNPETPGALASISALKACITNFNPQQ
jgi:prepilin-type N-terminal cleavage/methylation domain-containing protein